MPDRAQSGTNSADFLAQLQQVARRAGETVRPGDDNNIAIAQLVKHAPEFGSISLAAAVEDKGLRADTTDVLNKGEARHTLARAVAFHRLGRFRDRSHERQSHRAAALNLVTACIGLFNCRYLERAVAELRRQGVTIDDQRLRRMSPLGWDHVNLTRDYVWSDSPTYDPDGLRPLNREPEALAA